MDISTGISIINEALFFNKERILIINDLHLGYEEALHHKGVLVPKFQANEIIRKLEDIISKTSPKIIILNGDIKHEFGKILQQEWKDVLALLDFVSKKVKEIIIVAGNHDKVIQPLAIRKKVKVVPEYYVDNSLIVHGDELVETSAKRIIIGHEHPAITIREKSKMEKYKCFLKGKWKKKELIVMPSFNPLLEGTDVTKEQLLSPFLGKINTFEVFVISKGEVFRFGKVQSFNSGN